MEHNLFIVLSFITLKTSTKSKNMYFFVQNHDKKVKCSEDYLTHS